MMGTQLITPPVVIFGAPRSGTTYVMEILNAHPAVHITNEAKLFIWTHRTLRSLDDPAVSGCHADELRQYLKLELAEVVRNFYRKLWPSASVWGDKYPHYASAGREPLLHRIVELYPGAKFIHVIRDGRDVVASLLRKRDPSGEPWASFDKAHYIWNSHVMTGHRVAKDAAPGTALELRYEDLIADEVAHARALCDFIGIDCNSRVIEFCERQRYERTSFSGPMRNLRKGAELSEWEIVIGDEDQRRKSMSLLTKNLIRFGYPV